MLHALLIHHIARRSIRSGNSLPYTRAERSIRKPPTMLMPEDAARRVLCNRSSRPPVRHQYASRGQCWDSVCQRQSR